MSNPTGAFINYLYKAPNTTYNFMYYISVPGKDYKIGFLRLYTIDKSHNNDIIQNISNGQLIFDNNGNIQTSTFSTKNPIITNGTIDTTKTLANIKKNDITGTYTYTNQYVFSENLKYILYLDATTDSYVVLFNPMHTDNMKDEYNKFSSTELSYGTFTGSAPFNLQQIFNNYCDVFKSADASFVDPTCQCFYDKLQNSKNALYGGNQNYPDKTPDSIISILDGTSGTDHPAVCIAPGCSFGNNLSNSFVKNFVTSNYNGCDYDKEISLCNSIVNTSQKIDPVNDKTTFEHCANILTTRSGKYTCSNDGMCIADTNGSYYLNNCLDNCKPNQKNTHSCSGNTCYAQDDPTKAQFPNLDTCIHVCGKSCIKCYSYDTDKKKCINVDQNTGQYNTMKDCVNANTPWRYIDNVGKCISFSDGTGESTLNDCIDTNTPYVCTSDSGCVKKTGGLGVYNQTTCNANCTGTITLNWKCGEDNTTNEWKCTNVGKDNGQFSSQDECKKFCFNFKCGDSNACDNYITDDTENGDYRTQENCRNNCTPWSCYNNTSCKQLGDGSGKFATEIECINQCIPYKCNNGKCSKVNDGTGQYSDIDYCNSVCKNNNLFLVIIIIIVVIIALIGIGYYFLRKYHKIR